VSIEEDSIEYLMPWLGAVFSLYNMYQTHQPKVTAPIITMSDRWWSLLEREYISPTTAVSETRETLSATAHKYHILGLPTTHSIQNSHRAVWFDVTNVQGRQFQCITHRRHPGAAQLDLSPSLIISSLPIKSALHQF